MQNCVKLEYKTVQGAYTSLGAGGYVVEGEAVTMMAGERNHSRMAWETQEMGVECVIVGRGAEGVEQVEDEVMVVERKEEEQEGEEEGNNDEDGNGKGGRGGHEAQERPGRLIDVGPTTNDASSRTDDTVLGAHCCEKLSWRCAKDMPGVYWPFSERRGDIAR